MTGGTVQAFIAVSPRGHRIPSTIRPNADDAWAALRASISDPDSLHEAGWRIHRLECTVVAPSEDEKIDSLPEGMVRKGGRNREPSQVRERPPPPAPLRS